MTAVRPPAIGLVKRTSREGPSYRASGRWDAAALVRLAAASSIVIGCLVRPLPSVAASNKVRITNLSDVAFGTIANLSVDAIRSQSVCLYADTNTNGYHITATGSGPAGSFQLASGAQQLPYEVQWSNSAGQGSGTMLTANAPLTGQVSGATHQTCNNGPPSTASLIIVLRSSALSSVRAGTYNGTLTLVVGAE